MTRTARRSIIAIVALGLLTVVLVLLVGHGHRYTDTAGNQWTCTQSGALHGWPLVDCDGMQTLDRNPADGGVRGFLLDDGRITFRAVRWGDTPDTTVRVLETRRG